MLKRLSLPQRSITGRREAKGYVDKMDWLAARKGAMGRAAGLLQIVTRPTWMCATK